MEQWVFTPYDKDVDNALVNLLKNADRDSVLKIADYIKELERTIYSYTE